MSAKVPAAGGGARSAGVGEAPGEGGTMVPCCTFTGLPTLVRCRPAMTTTSSALIPETFQAMGIDLDGFSPTDDGYRFDIRLQGDGETVFFDV